MALHLSGLEFGVPEFIEDLALCQRQYCKVKLRSSLEFFARATLGGGPVRIQVLEVFGRGEQSGWFRIQRLDKAALIEFFYEPVIHELLGFNIWHLRITLADKVDHGL